jgi:predicted RNase H-like HicB family nuclease
MKPTKTRPFDPANYIKTAEDCGHFLTDAFTSNDPAFIADSLAVACRVRGVMPDTGIDGQLKLGAFLAVLGSLGLQIRVEPARKQLTHYAAIMDGAGDVWGLRVPDLPGVFGGGPNAAAAIADTMSAARDWSLHKMTGGYAAPPPRPVADVTADPRADFRPASECVVIIPLELDRTDFGLNGHYAAIMEGSDDVWSLRVPDLPGVHGAGPDLAAAIADTVSAARDWAAHKTSGGHAVPPPRPVPDVIADPSVRFAAATEWVVLIAIADATRTSFDDAYAAGLARFGDLYKKLSD